MQVMGTTLTLKPTVDVTIPTFFFKKKNNNKSNFMIFLGKRKKSDRNLCDVDLKAKY